MLGGQADFHIHTKWLGICRNNVTVPYMKCTALFQNPHCLQNTLPLFIGSQYIRVKKQVTWSKLPSA